MATTGCGTAPNPSRAIRAAPSGSWCSPPSIRRLAGRVTAPLSSSAARRAWATFAWERRWGGGGGGVGGGAAGGGRAALDEAMACMCEAGLASEQRLRDRLERSRRKLKAALLLALRAAW